MTAPVQPAGSDVDRSKPSDVELFIAWLVAAPALAWLAFWLAATWFPRAFTPASGAITLAPAQIASAGLVLGLLAALARFEHSPRAADRFIRVAFATVFVIAVLPSAGFDQMRMGVDPSWWGSLALAVEQHLVFGRDFLFTYGPLGFVWTGMPPDGWTWAVIAHDLLLTADVIWIAWVGSRLVKSPLWWPLTALVFVGVSNQLFRTYAPYVWLTALGFHCARFLSDRETTHLAAAVAISVLLFFTKLTVGMVAPLPVLYVLGSLALSPAPRRWPVWLGVPAYLALIVVCATLLHVDLRTYLQGGAHIISAYPDAMYIPMFADFYYMVCWEVAFILLFVGVIARYWRGLLTRGGVFLVLYTLASLFVIFKQGHIRQWGTFLRTESLPLWLFLALAPPAAQRAATAPLGLSIIAAAALVGVMLTPEAVRQHVDGVRRSAVQYTDLATHTRTRASLAVLPAAVVRVLKSGTVDVVMSETSLVYLEGLRYRPRPVIQSYAAYDAYLDGVNADRFQSSDAPDFILFHVHPGGDRYWFSDETKTRLTMLQWYDDLGRFESFVVLKRRLRPRTLLRSAGSSGLGRLGRPVQVSSAPNQLTVGSFAINYSTLGKLARLVLQPPPLYVTLRLQTGAPVRYRAIVPIFQGGVVIDRFVAEDLVPARQFLAGKWDTLPRIEDVTFDTTETWGFERQFHYIMQHVELTAENDNPVQAAAADPWAAVEGDTRLLRLGGALPADPGEITWLFGSCRGGVVERIVPATGTKVDVAGWAFVEPTRRPPDAVIATAGVGLRPDVVAAALVGSSRPDVAQAYKQESALATGWHVTMSAPPIDPRKMTFWAYDMAERRAYPLCFLP